MGAFVRGEVVIIPFPYSDLSDNKRRPALVIADLTGDDLILCQITSQGIASDKYSVGITNTDFQKGRLDKDSFIRPNRLFTGDSHIVIYKAGELKDQKFDEVINKLTAIITGRL